MNDLRVVGEFTTFFFERKAPIHTMDEEAVPLDSPGSLQRIYDAWRKLLSKDPVHRFVRYDDLISETGLDPEVVMGTLKHCSQWITCIINRFGQNYAFRFDKEPF